MKYLSILLLSLFISVPTIGQDIQTDFKSDANTIIGAAMGNDIGFQRLTYLVDNFGPRLSGSENLENAIDWIVETMKEDGFDKVWKQPVMVPHWVRVQKPLSRANEHHWPYHLLPPKQHPALLQQV